ncbi:MAG: hypothetical protein H2069_06020 [Legionella sp.]|nr:hypothetical protein [Legionella sp.]
MPTANPSKKSTQPSQTSGKPTNQDRLNPSKKRDQTLKDSFPASDPPPPNPSSNEHNQ